MEKGSLKIRSIYNDPADMLIEALVSEKNNSNVFHIVAFKANAIDYVMDVNETVSAIVLKSKLTIPVALPFLKLKEMIYDSEDSTLDLTGMTGRAIGDLLVPTLVDEFNAKAGFSISAILRKPNTNQAIRFDFSEADVSSFEKVEGNTRA